MVNEEGRPRKIMKRIFGTILPLLCALVVTAQEKTGEWHVLAFYSAGNDLAHISFVNEAKSWFAAKGREIGYCFETTSDWSKLNYDAVRAYDLIIFLDSRPEEPVQRESFRRYMEEGGAWMGFHFAAFALTPSAFPQNWEWYHNDFLGSGMYRSNTWRPTSAVLRVEKEHPVTTELPAKFKSAPNEWYRWESELRANPEIDILVSIDPESFPLGTGPKEDEIWHEGYYPVVWTNRRFRMVYFNMGHNDMDYDGGTDKSLSSTFGSKAQNLLITNALVWSIASDDPD
jgi:hypothetical protein